MAELAQIYDFSYNYSDLTFLDRNGNLFFDSIGNEHQVAIYSTM